jgi:hypothetical protein
MIQGKKYCGSKPSLPAGYTRKGTPLECLRSGIAIANAQFKEMLGKQGLMGLKKYIHLSKLNKDEVRSIAVRLSGSNDAIPQYWKLSKEELRRALLQRGFKD